MAQIFISYAREDRDRAEMLARALEGAGFSVWWDRQLETGAEYSRDIEAELEASRVVIVAWSTAAAASPWVRDEAAHGRDQGKLFPVRLDDSTVPIGFRQFQAADLSRWSGDSSPEIDELARTLRRRLDGPADPRSSAESVPKKIENNRRPAWIVPAGVVAAGLVVLAAARFLLAPPPPGAGEALTRSLATSPIEGPPAVAVLPFANFSNEADQAFFADGMTEEILNVLSRIDGMRVTSRTSAFSFKDSKAGISEIAKTLGVRHVLEGSVRKSGTTLRVTAQLIDARTDKHLWSRTFDRPYSADDMLAIQDEIAAAIVKEMQASLSTPSSSGFAGSAVAEYAPPPTVMTRSTEAYEAYLRGSQLVEHRTRQSLLAGIRDLERAVSIDPEFAQAYAKLADASLLANYKVVHARDARARAAGYADRALALAPDSAEALAAKAFVEFEAGRPRAAIDYGQRAIRANPNYIPGYKRLASALSAAGRGADALPVFESAKAIDPLNRSILASIANHLLNMNDLDAAQRSATENNQLYPHMSDAVLAEISYTRGDYAQAHRLLKGLEADSSVELNALWRLYENVGMTRLAKEYADTWDEEAYAALVVGDRAKALALAATNAEDRSAFWQGPGWVAHATGDHALSYRIYRGDFDNVFDRQDPLISAFRSGYAIAMLAEFEHAGDPDATIVRTALVKYFDGRKVDDFTYDNQLSGAAWKALNDDADGAIEWLSTCADRGAVFGQVKFLPEFDSIRTRPDFAGVVAKMDANAARHRAAIDAQLAAPPADWIKR